MGVATSSALTARGAGEYIWHRLARIGSLARASARAQDQLQPAAA